MHVALMMVHDGLMYITVSRLSAIASSHATAYVQRIGRGGCGHTTSTVRAGRVMMVMMVRSRIGIHSARRSTGTSSL